MQSLLSRETVLCLQDSKKRRRNAHSFLTTEKDLLVVNITSAENKMPETLCQLP